MEVWVEKATKIMKKKKISQKDIAPAMGVKTRGAVSHYFTGRCNPTTHQLKGLANCLGVSLNYLLIKNAKNASIDRALLRRIIEKVSIYENNSSDVLSPYRKSRLIAYLYDQHIKGVKLNDEAVSDLLETWY